jgi:hypothetical protein
VPVDADGTQASSIPEAKHHREQQAKILYALDSEPQPISALFGVDSASDHSVVPDPNPALHDKFLD